MAGERIGMSWWLVGILLAFAVLAAVPLAILSLLLAGRIRQAQRLRALDGRAFLVWHRRRRWYDFVRNNVLPVMPAGVTAVEDTRVPDPLRRTLRRAAGDYARGWPARPYLVQVCGPAVRARSLNRALGPWKSRAGRATDVQRAVERIVVDELHRLGQPAGGG